MKDTGIGIPKDRQNAIFERFVQADIEYMQAYQGAGLGLSITSAYVELLGGRIWVESEEGTGSAFFFTLPYNAGPAAETDAKNGEDFEMEETQIDSEVSGLKILIAEDDKLSGKLISLIINELNNEIIKVRTGIEAVEACRKNHDIDLVLMDIQMPEMDGYEATRSIRSFNQDVVIIAQTAYGLTGHREDAIAAGCNDYISEPFNKSELIAVIKKHLKK